MFRFRKSFGFGPFRLNIFKGNLQNTAMPSLSVSGGIPGLRFTKQLNKRRARTATVSLPGTGLHYMHRSVPGMPGSQLASRGRGILTLAKVVGGIMIAFVLLGVLVAWLTPSKPETQTEAPAANTQLAATKSEPKLTYAKDLPAIFAAAKEEKRRFEQAYKGHTLYSGAYFVRAARVSGSTDYAVTLRFDTTKSEVVCLATRDQSELLTKLKPKQLIGINGTIGELSAAWPPALQVTSCEIWN